MQSSCSHHECILRSPFALPPLPSEHRTSNTCLVGYLTWSAKARTLVSPTFLTLPWFFRAPAMSTFLPDAFVQYYRDSFGAGVMGCMLAMGIYGLTTSQTYFYFVEYPRDGIWLKTFVSVLCNPYGVSLPYPERVRHFCTISPDNDIFLECYFPVHVSVSDSPQTFPDCRYGFRQQPKTSVVVDSSQRDCNLGVYWLRDWYARQPSMCLTEGISSLETVVDLFKTPSVLSLTAYTKIAFLPLAATQAGADSMMAISLCFVLFNHRTGFRRTNSLLHTLMLYAINRCLLTAGAAMVALLMIAIKPDSLIYIGPQFVISGRTFLPIHLSQNDLT
ncbi:hypothetical protein B0H14DRAFT_803169 [Mycena olivaceomarginata]|nr:hypothetical protein B0H14DRAFT_803169 [Mycena olivaceomarginata]